MADVLLENNDEVMEERESPVELLHAISYMVTAGDGGEQVIHEIEVEALDEGDVSLDESREESVVEVERDDTTSEDPSEQVMTNSMEEMNDILEGYYTRTSNRFAITNYKGMKVSLEDIDFSQPHKIYWEDINSSTTNSGLVYDGIPFMIYGRIILCCQFGDDQNLSAKKKADLKRKLSENTKERHVGRKRGSKKCGCPAQAIVRRIIKFPGFKLEKDQDTVRRRKNFSKTLKEMLKDNSRDVEMRDLFVGVLPPVSQHRFHENVKCTFEPVDKEIMLKVQEMALQNIHTVDIMKELEVHVCQEMFYMKIPPDKTHRRYFPTLRDVRSIARSAREAAKIQQTHLNHLKSHSEALSEKHPGTTLHFDIDGLSLEQALLKDVESQGLIKDKKTTPDNVQEFVFFHQSPSQQVLLNKYGSIIYITQVYPPENGSSRALTVSLFLMFVRTNVDYQVVGTILMSRFKENGLKESLLKCREANEAWMPKYFMIDLNEELLLSIGDLFPEADYFVTKASCNRLWRQFLSRRSNGVSQEHTQILAYLNSMRVSATKDELTYAASALEHSDVWKRSECLRNWFQGQWLPIAEKWVREYLPDDLQCFIQETRCDNLIATYQDALMITTIRNKEGGIVRLVEKLTVDLLHDNFENYVVINREHYENCKRVQKLNPIWEFQFALPLSLYPRVAPVIESLDEVVSVVAQTSYGCYEVSVNLSSETGEPKLECFVVAFGNQAKFPSCTCERWRVTYLPCNHMFTVFKNFPYMKYDSLSPLYRSNPIFAIDYSCLGNDFYVKPVSVATQTAVGTQTRNTVQAKPAKVPLNAVAQKQKVNKNTRSVKTDKVVKIIDHSSHPSSIKTEYLVEREIPIRNVEIRSIKDVLSSIPKEMVEKFKNSLKHLSTKDNLKAIDSDSIDTRSNVNLVNPAMELPSTSSADEVENAVVADTLLQIEELILPREETVVGYEQTGDIKSTNPPEAVLTLGNEDEPHQLKLLVQLLEEDHQEELTMEEHHVGVEEDCVELAIATKRKCDDTVVVVVDGDSVASKKSKE